MLKGNICMKSIAEKIKYLGFINCIRLVRDLVFSGIFVKVGSVVRHPFYIRKSGKMIFGDDFRAGPGLVVDLINKDAVLKIGISFRANSRLHIGCLKSIEIGDNVLIASDVYITDHSHGNYSGNNQSHPEEIVNKRKLLQNDVFIGNNVWIGEKACILLGTKIGKNSIIAAGSVVKGCFPDNCIIGGTPAIVLKKFDQNEKIWVKISE
jgi:lipopolysaccharide O-acetyltransferase